MTTLNLQVGASADDAEEIAGLGTVDLTNNQLRIGNVAAGRHVGVRFTGVSGLSGATINSATLQFYAYYDDTGTNMEGDWYAHDAQAPGVFTTTDFNISDTAQRPRTTATCGGDGVDFGDWTASTWETFDGPAPGIKGIVQELADSYDPSAIALLWIYVAGNQERICASRDGGSNYAPKLDIDYTAGGAAPTTEYRRHGENTLIRM